MKLITRLWGSFVSKKKNWEISALRVNIAVKAFLLGILFVNFFGCFAVIGLIKTAKSSEKHQYFGKSDFIIIFWHGSYSVLFADKM